MGSFMERRLPNRDKTLMSTQLRGWRCEDQGEVLRRACCAGLRPNKTYEEIEDELMSVIDGTLWRAERRISLNIGEDYMCNIL